MKVFWLASLLLAGSLPFPDASPIQDDTPPADKEKKQEKPMRKHPAVNLYLDIPDDFILAFDWRGYFKETTESSILLHESERSLEVMKRSFLDDARLRKINRRIVKREERKINGYEGYYVEILGDREGREYKIFSVLFGDDDGTCIVSGQYFTEIAEELDAALLKNAVLNVYWDRPPKIDPFDHVRFTIDEKKIGALRYVGKEENKVMFAFGQGVDTTRNPGRPLLFVEQRKGKIAEEDREALVRKQLEAVPELRDYKVDEEFEAVEIGGLAGYQGYGYGISELHKDMYGDDMPVTVLHVTLFDEENHYFISGVIATKIGKNWLKMFKSGIDSFKLKTAEELAAEAAARKGAEEKPDEKPDGEGGDEDGEKPPRDGE